MILLYNTKNIKLLIKTLSREISIYLSYLVFSKTLLALTASTLGSYLSLIFL